MKSLLRAVAATPLVFAWSFVFFFGPPSPASAEEKKPNILFLFADDWGKFASIYAEVEGAGGINDVVDTPHFDRIAKEGVLFRNAHVSAPSCTPCRSALLTGQHFWRTNTGAILRGAVWDDSLPSFPLLLEDAGYHIGYTYKVWGPGTPSNAPFTKEQNFGKRGRAFNQFSQNVTKKIGEGASVEEAKESLLGEVRGNFQDFLAARREGEPFFYWFGPTNVHRKWIKGSGRELWGIDPDDLQGKLPPFLPDVPEVREDLADYLGEVRAWDAAIGVVLEELEKTGERENTLIAISGDHGAPGFPHGKCNLYGFGTNVALSVTGPGVRGGRVVEDFTSLTDLAPTFLEAAGLPVPEVMTGRSLRPVLRSEKSGLVDATRTVVHTGRERHVESARADFSPYPQRAIRTPDHVLIVNFRPDRYPLGDHYLLEDGHTPPLEELENVTRVTLPDEDAGPTKAWLVGARNTAEWKEHFDWVYGKRPRYELYDLKKDPYETTNVADAPAYASVRKDLETRLFDELTRTGDPRLIDDGRFFETPPMAGPLAAPPGASKGGKKGKAKKEGQTKGGSAAATKRPPNLIWIMADDLGWGELGSYGQEIIRTPRLDRMAEEGMRFTHFYAGATVCAPSRSVLMTGRHHGHTRVRGNAGKRNPAAQALRSDDVTVAAALKKAGYRTALMGKWGLGDMGEAESGLPRKHGFDEFFGYLHQGHAHNHFTDFLWRNETKIPLPNEVTPIGESGAGYAADGLLFSDDLVTDEALKFVARNQDKPFFLYWSLVIPHANNERRRELGDGAHVPDYGPYATKNWPDPDKGHAAMITRLDGYVGRMLDQLRSLGLAENTLVIFTSDNGPHNESNHDLDRFDPSGPYSGIKRSLTDGGIRVPFLAWWPGTVKPAVSDHVGYFPDWFATAAELAETGTPAGLDGISLVPLLTGHPDEQKKHEFLYWEFHEGGFQQAALYEGRWKGIRRGGPDAPVKLYDQKNDPAEQTDVAARHPEIAAKIGEYLKTARTPLAEWEPKWKPPGPAKGKGKGKGKSG